MDPALAALLLRSGMGSPFLGLSGIRKGRGKKAAASRVTNQLAASEWAASAGERPFSLADLVGAGMDSPAYRFFDGLSLADTKKECAMHGLPITGAKYKLFASLLKHAHTAKFGNPKRGCVSRLRPTLPHIPACLRYRDCASAPQAIHARSLAVFTRGVLLVVHSQRSALPSSARGVLAGVIFVRLCTGPVLYRSTTVGPVP
jgi:hypothetical protein